MKINTDLNNLFTSIHINFNFKKMSEDLEKLSTGLRINKAADDSSGLQLADILNNQATSSSRAIKNANEASGLLTIADGAINEQIKIINIIKTKAIQAAQDGQNLDTRKAIQNDIARLIQELDNIANTTTYNGQKLLNGKFVNKKFQIGPYSQDIVSISINSTASNKIGHVRYEVGSTITAAATVNLTFKSVDGLKDVKIENVIISHSANTGIGVLAEVINKNSEKTGVRASWEVKIVANAPVNSGSIENLKINNVLIGTINEIQKNDKDNKLVNAINSLKSQTGVEAFIDNEGKLNLRSIDGRGIVISATNLSAITNITQTQNYGNLTLIRLDARDIIVSGSGAGLSNAAEYTYNLREMPTITTTKSAMIVMDIADSAIKMLDKIRAEIGSAQHRVYSSIEKLSTFYAFTKEAESRIRDADIGNEYTNFQKHSLLMMAGSFMLAQANVTKAHVFNLLKSEL